MHESPMHARDRDTIIPSPGEMIPSCPTTEGPSEMSRATILQLIIVAIISIAVFFGMTAYSEKTHAWIVLDFTTHGHLTQIAFSNPDTFNEDECRQSLPKALEFLISTAIQRTPALRHATVTGARCMMSVNDPIGKSGKL